MTTKKKGITLTKIKAAYVCKLEKIIDKANRKSCQNSNKEHTALSSNFILFYKALFYAVILMFERTCFLWHVFFSERQILLFFSEK